MNMDDMRALVAVVEEGSLAHAATRLHLTQPAVTRRIQRLEQDLDTTLLDRETRPSKPTRNGLRAYRECLTILRASDGLREAVGGSVPTDLRVGISYALADRFISPLFNHNKANSPDVMLEFFSERSSELRDRLAEGRLDAAIILLEEGRRPDPREHPIHLGTEGVRVAMARDLGLPERGKLLDYTGHPWVINPEGCGYRKALEAKLRDAGEPIVVAASVWGVALQLQLIAEGAGLGLVPQSFAEGPRWRDKIALPVISDFSPHLDVWFIRSSHLGGLTTIVDSLADVLSHEIGQPVASAAN